MAVPPYHPAVPQDVSDYPKGGKPGGGKPGGAPPPTPPIHYWFGWDYGIAGGTPQGWSGQGPCAADGWYHIHVSCWQPHDFWTGSVITSGSQYLPLPPMGGPAVCPPSTPTSSGCNTAQCINTAPPQQFDFSVQDSSGTNVPLDLSNWGPLFQQGLRPTSINPNSFGFGNWNFTNLGNHVYRLVDYSPSYVNYEQHISYYGLIPGTYTFNISNMSAGGVSCNIFPSGTFVIAGTTWAGPPVPNPCAPPAAAPTWYCDDYNCQEIMYDPATAWTVGSGEVFSGSLLSSIITTSTIPNNPYPYTIPGGVWHGFTSLLPATPPPWTPNQVATTLAQMANTPGPVGYAWTPHPGTLSWTPLHSNIDDCIACCGGINIPTYSSGTPNPYYGDYSTHPTPIQNAGFAAYLTSNPNATMITYLATLGIHNCGDH